MTAVSASAPPWAETALATRSRPPGCMEAQATTTIEMASETASVIAARSEARFLIQRVKLETGDVIYDLSVPVTVKGKHWGCARIGYRRTE